MEHFSKPERLGFLDRYLTVWIFAAMALGVDLGTAFTGLPAALNSLSLGPTNVPIAIGLTLLMYPPLARVRYDELSRVFADKHVLVLSLVPHLLMRQSLFFAPLFTFSPHTPNYL